MNNLTRQQKAEILVYDTRARENAAVPNQNRFYTYLTLEARDDVGVRTVAVKGHPKTGKPHVKEVVRASVDSKRLRVRDLGFAMLAGYCVDWSPEGVGRPHEWSYEGEWGIEAYNPRRNNWKIQCPLVNRALLLAVPRFRYCSWTPDCGHPLDYLKHYAAAPRIECLAKAGIGWLACRRPFCARLERDRGLMGWVAKNREEIRKQGGNVTEILYAHKRNLTLAAARRELEIRKEFDGLDLPKSFDRLAAWAWLKARDIPIHRYRPYLGLCAHYKLDLGDTKNSKPRDFEARMCGLQDRKDAEDRARYAEEARRNKADRARERRAEKREAVKIAAAIAGVRERLVKIERLSAPFKVYLPSDEADLRTEAKGMGSSCVWSYGNKIARGESVVLFVRLPDAPAKPFVTVEFKPDTREVSQCYATNNSKPGDDVLAFVHGTLQKQLRKLHKTTTPKGTAA